MHYALEQRQSDPVCTSIDCKRDRSLGRPFDRYNDVRAQQDSTNVQLGSQSDPICNSSGCTQYQHPGAKEDWPKNYFVPDFGLDSDIKDSITHMETMEEKYLPGDAQAVLQEEELAALQKKAGEDKMVLAELKEQAETKHKAEELQKKLISGENALADSE